MKKLILASLIALSFNMQAAQDPTAYSKDQINEFECSPEEMNSILNQENIKDRITQTTYSAFEDPYREANVAEKSGKQPNEITQSDKEEFDGGLSCLDVNPIDINKIWDALDQVGKIVTDGYAKAGELFDKIGDELTKDFCERVKNTASDLGDEFSETAKDHMEDRIREEKWGRILDGENGAEYLINKQIDESYEDKEGLLNWRNGGLDKDHFKNRTDSLFKNEVEDLYEEFDDQAEEKTGLD